MANIFPTIENIKKLKVQPTEGEWSLLNYFAANLPDDVEIYFQPFLNGDMPDIILIQKDIGVTILEVKDWDLNSYRLDEKGDWHLKSNGCRIKSPFKQVFRYKDNMFNLHINGLLEKKILDKRFYGRINVYVYFHGADRDDVNNFFAPQLIDIDKKIDQRRNDDNKKGQSFLQNQYQKLTKQRDDYSRCAHNIKTIRLPNKVNELFPESIYLEFKRYLKPPFHTVEQGIETHYSKRQIELSESNNKHQKIKGVAGSGKTLILAKRAVNSHKRHKDDVLILTFNITLTSYIHDMISNVREEFDWRIFTILNYHHFFNMIANKYGLEIESLSDYGDEEFFNSVAPQKYQSIFIDEIQDYEVSWIKIVKKYFLTEDGEFVVFGDEKQNIYDRKLGYDKRPNTTIDGRWNLLKESFRLDTKIAQLAEDFQGVFFKEKYDIEHIESAENKQLSLDMTVENNLIKQYEFAGNNLNSFVSTMFEIIRNNDIHQNDVCVLACNIKLLRDVDFIIRQDFNFRTMTTFETIEVFKKLSKDITNKDILGTEIKNVRKVKKYGFRLNNGMMKLSTIQSFKGWEIPTLFLIIDSDFEEIIYTALTRARHNVIIFNVQNNKYYNFFNGEVSKLQ